MIDSGTILPQYNAVNDISIMLAIVRLDLRGIMGQEEKETDKTKATAIDRLLGWQP